MAPVKTLSILNLALSIGGTLAGGKYLLQLGVIGFFYVIGRFLGEVGSFMSLVQGGAAVLAVCERASPARL
ncbi:hypothetical protein [Shewanella sp.]|uniref:hypothetical protein n=1 Tax=Shewanella sp. TaxID=50422 RepID=UPI003F68068F